MSQKYPQLSLENQLCFPLYATAKEIVRRYTPYLQPLGMTYTQYIVMMVMWDRKQITVSQLGEVLLLDSGTLTPLLKKMESKGYVKRIRNQEDERIVEVHITEEGMALQDKLAEVPGKVGATVKLKAEEVVQLYTLLYKVLGGFEAA